MLVQNDILPAVWRASEPYLRVRKNDIHVPISFDFARRLIGEHQKSDALVVSLAILMHDNGWHTIDEEIIFAKAFGPDMMQSDVRIQHEKEGARIAGEILAGLSLSRTVIDEVCAIIDGHDTRAEALSLNDALVKDADKLWRFTPTGVALASGWFKKTPADYMRRLEAEIIPQLFTKPSKIWARADLAASRDLLQAQFL